MTGAEWKKIDRIFRKASRLDRSQRSAYLNKACYDDGAILKEVQSLLAEHDKTGPFVGVYSSIGGTILGHYQVLDQIGQGGMALVYQARDTRLDRTVAIKVLPPWAVANPESRQQLMREAKFASALNHPNIVTVHEIAQAGDIEFIVMEYVPGKALDSIIPRTGLAVPTTLKYALQIADALTAAHTAGILHRDLKPSNVRVTDESRVKLLDFGLAQPLTSSGPDDSDVVTGTDLFGTKIYMAPEQLRNPRAKLDPRSEIFSFGLILSEMLSGRHPFGPGPPDKITEAIQTKAPKTLPSRIPTSLTNIVMRCLEKEPGRRFQSMRDACDALKGCAQEDRAGYQAVTTSVGPATLRQISSVIKRIGYANVSRSRQALAELTDLLQRDGSKAVREAVTSATKDLILTAADFVGGVPDSVREVRKLALDVIKLSTQGNLTNCFKSHDLEYLDLYGMNFGFAQLTEMSFKRSFLVEANFQQGRLARASFAQAYIRNVDFTDADLSGVDFTDADWFNAEGLTATQLSASRRETLMDCPATVADMHRRLEARYGFSFDSWSGKVKRELRTAWNEYLRPRGLREIVASWRTEVAWLKQLEGLVGNLVAVEPRPAFQLANEVGLRIASADREWVRMKRGGGGFQEWRIPTEAIVRIKQQEGEPGACLCLDGQLHMVRDTRDIEFRWSTGAARPLS